MIRTLLIIRLKQIYRGLIGIGFFRIVFLLGLMGFLGIMLFTKTSNESTSQYISLGLLVLLLMIQLGRSDKLFLKRHFPGFKSIILTEYIAISTPVLFCLMFHGQWIPTITLFFGLLIIVHLDAPPTGKSLNTKLQDLIPPDCIEWKSGLRKQFFIIVPTWIIAALTSFFIGSVPTVIFILGILTFSFFERCEPYQVLLSYEFAPCKFLLHKVKRQIQLFSVVVMPLIGLYLIFNFDKWYIPVAEFIIFVFLHIYIIMVKYAFYEPNTKSPAAQTFGGIGALGGIIPIFLPLVWSLTIWFYLKSINKLNYYLNDYH